MMSRLTNKKLVDLKDGEFLAVSKEEYRKQVHEAPTYKEIYTKLGKLEDLEDELGCPLDVVFKAIEDGLIYFKEDDGWSADFSLDNNGSNWYFDVFDDTNNETSVFLKDYQKTWWLKGDKSE